MTPATRTLTGILAAAALAAPALAQTQSFDGRAAFRADHNASSTPTIPNGGTYEYNAAGQTAPITLNFALMLGGFDAQGFENQGMFAWRGEITVEGTGISFSNAPGARTPFNFSPVGNGIITPDGQTISNIDVVRNPIINVPWPAGGPAPVPDPRPQGNDAYFSAFRFTLTNMDLSLREITVTATGTMQVISEWAQFGGSEGEFADYIAGRYVTDQTVSASFTFFVPAPAAVPLLGLAGLLAARRRRN